MENFDITKDVGLLIGNYCTSESLAPVISKLETLAASYYTVNKAPLFSSLVEIFPAFLSQSMSFTSDACAQARANDALVLEYVKEILAVLKNAKVSYVTLAFDPSQEYLTQLHSRVTAIVRSVVVLRVKVDKNILGGCIVSFEGLYKDLSLVSCINKYFLSNKQYVQKLL